MSFRSFMTGRNADGSEASRAQRYARTAAAGGPIAALLGGLIGYGLDRRDAANLRNLTSGVTGRQGRQIASGNERLFGPPSAPGGAPQDAERQIGDVIDRSGDNPLQATSYGGGGSSSRPTSFGPGFSGASTGATATNAGNWRSFSGLGSMNPTGGRTLDEELAAAYNGYQILG